MGGVACSGSSVEFEVVEEQVEEEVREVVRRMVEPLLAGLEGRRWSLCIRKRWIMNLKGVGDS